MNRFKFFLLALFAGLTMAGAAVRADEGGLYTPAAPHGSSFVRFVTGDGGDSPLMKIRGKTYAAAQQGEPGTYYYVPPGDADLAMGAKTIKFTLKPDGRYTVILLDGKLTVLEEAPNDNALKTPIVLINLSKATDATLKTADGSVTVVGPVQPGALQSRTVNPVRIGFSAYAGGAKVGDIPESPLERGLGYTAVIYTGANGKPTVYWMKSKGL